MLKGRLRLVGSTAILCPPQVAVMVIVNRHTLGADAVSVGRHLMPFIREGVEPLTNRMKAMTAELAGVMSATGVKSLKEMDPSVIHKTLF